MSSIYDFTPLWGLWEIDSLIGTGSFGKVYKAVRTDFDQTYVCAIKHISIPADPADVDHYYKENGSRNPTEASQYFSQIVRDVTDEINIMYRLKGNTNIVSYEEHLAIPKADGIGHDIFIKMEYLTDLPTLVERQPLSADEVARLGIDICTALEVCAQNNLIHRDIKPHNIFVNEKRDYKLGDFGISRTLEKTAAGLSQKGTYSYMAPEVYRGEEYGPNVDIYSLGLVLYRLLNKNRLPFLPLPPNAVQYSDNEAAMKRRFSGEALPLPVDADPAFAAIVLKMCAFDRAERYATPTEVKNDLLMLSQDSTRLLGAGIGGSLYAAQPQPAMQPLAPAATQPLPAQPYGIQQQPYPAQAPYQGAQPQPYYDYTQGGYPPPYAPPKKKNTGIVVTGIIAGVLVLGIGATLVWRFLIAPGSGGTPQNNLADFSRPAQSYDDDDAASSQAAGGASSLPASAADSSQGGALDIIALQKIADDVTNEDLVAITADFYLSYLDCVNALPGVKSTAPLRGATERAIRQVEDRLDRDINSQYGFEYTGLLIDSPSRVNTVVEGVPSITYTVEFYYYSWPKNKPSQRKASSNIQDLQLLYIDGQWLVNDFVRHPDD